MWQNVINLSKFYRSPLGRLSTRDLRRNINSIWPNVKGEDVVCLGFAAPYASLFHRKARRVLMMVPFFQKAPSYTSPNKSLTSLVDIEELPLADNSVSRLLILHTFEFIEQKEPFLRECWRVLAPEGRLILCVPNQYSLWSYSKNTPFSSGYPLSRQKVFSQLQHCFLTPLKTYSALCFFPWYHKKLFRVLRRVENFLPMISPFFAGVFLIEAIKHVAGLIAVDNSKIPARFLPTNWRPKKAY